MPTRADAWMWAEACELLDRADRMHRQFFRPGESPNTRPAWEPPVDVFETDSDLAIQVALPGVLPAELELAVADGVLTVAGERRLPEIARRAAILRVEIPHGRFERRIALPPGRYEIGPRSLAEGCLTIVLHKRDGGPAR